MSSSPSRPTHYRQYSWTPSLPDEHLHHETEATREACLPEHARGIDSAEHAHRHQDQVMREGNAAQHAHSHQDEHGSRTSSFQDSLRFFFSHISPVSDRPKKEFVVTGKRKTQSRANMDGDKGNNSAPSSRTVAPGPLESLDSNEPTPRSTLPPSISIQIPISALSTEQTSQAPVPDTPAPTAVSTQSSKSVKFASPVKTQTSSHSYADLGDEEGVMVGPYTTESKRRSVSNQNNIDSDFRLNTRRRSTEHPVEKLKKRTSFFSQRRVSSLPVTQTAVGTDEDPLLAPQRSASITSSKSLSDHFAFLRFPSKSSKRLSKALPPPSSTTTTAITAPADLSDLPTDRTALEGRINYHISRLDRLKCRLADLNNAIFQEAREYNVSKANLRAQGMFLAAEDLAKQLAWLRQSRDGLKPSVVFHRGELERIARKRMEMDAAEGYVVGLPAVYANLDGDEAWEGRFVA